MLMVSWSLTITRFFFKIISEITDLVRILVTGFVLFQRSCRYRYMCTNTCLQVKDLVSSVCIVKHQVNLSVTKS